MLRVVRPELVTGHAEGHDGGLWTCLCRLFGTSRTPGARACHCPSFFGRVGSEARTRDAAYWTSWADCPLIVRNKHSVVADRILNALNRMDDLESLGQQQSQLTIWQVLRVEVPSWEALSGDSDTESRTKFES